MSNAVQHAAAHFRLCASALCAVIVDRVAKLFDVFNVLTLEISFELAKCVVVVVVSTVVHWRGNEWSTEEEIAELLIQRFPSIQ